MLQKLDRLFVFSYNVQPAAWDIFSASIHAAPVVTKMWRMWTLLWNKWMWASVVWGHQFCTPDGRMEQVRYTNHRMSTITHYVCVCVRARPRACALSWTWMWWGKAHTDLQNHIFFINCWEALLKRTSNMTLSLCFCSCSLHFPLCYLLYFTRS